jgi:GH15 family glucan-1,4-alpha-glucosidase
MEAPPGEKIQDYGLIGDTLSAALVSRLGSIDWLCWPRFDSSSVFARLLDPEGGSFGISPTAEARVSRRYLEDSNILETRFENAGGAATLTDFMTVCAEGRKRDSFVAEREILRHLVCERGGMELEVHFAPRPDFGRARVRLRDAGRLGFRLDLGSTLLLLRTDARLLLRGDGTAGARLWLHAGETRTFALSYHTHGPAVMAPITPAAVEDRLECSHAWWRLWAAHAKYHGPYRDAVVRSALLLKLMCFSPSGAVVAAPTTSLPERLGGDLNWDYRFCWLRDAALTVRALFGLGYEVEANCFVSWLLHTTRLTRPRLEVLYDVYGGRTGRETCLTSFAGYAGSRPVRLGNAASRQLQLDVYGEVVDAATQVARREGRLDGETRALLRGIGTYVIKNWRRPDAGIWEVRGHDQEHTHSRLLCWTALDRLLELVRAGILEGLPASRLEAACAAVRDDIEQRAWSDTLGAYTQTLGGSTLDASSLQLVWYGLLRAESPRMRSCSRRLLERLAAGPGLLYRNEQSLAIGEGAFATCSFWWVEFLARGGGSLAEASDAFEHTLAYANDLGLFAEEIDPRTGDALGNFPQAFTHIGLINAALSLAERGQRDRREGAARQRGDR